MLMCDTILHHGFVSTFEIYLLGMCIIVDLGESLHSLCSLSIKSYMRSLTSWITTNAYGRGASA